MKISCPLAHFSFLFLGIVLSVIVVQAAAADDNNDLPPDFDINDMMNKNCPNFRCSAGMTPTPKSRLKFESTGCDSVGAGNLMMMAGGGNAVKPYDGCCHQWHACYQVCGVAKNTCDTNFETCAKASCTEKTADADDAGDSDSTCEKDAELSVMMMKLSGCQTFNQAQYKACECTATDKVASKREAALRYFYTKQAPENLDKVGNLIAKADTASKMAGLFIKLLAKYPAAIAKKEDPMKEMYEKIQRETQEKMDEEASETEEEVPPDEHIEL